MSSFSESAPAAILHEAIFASVSSVRDSLPEQHRAHFDTLRQEIIDFAASHGIPKEALAKTDLLREAANKLPTPDLERLANLLERFEHLLVHHKLMKEETDPVKALEYAEEHYHLKEQYTSQVELLEQVGILENGVITGIDGHEYLVPTLEQIASRLFERRETLKTKHDQGFTKLLLVPFGMSLDTLIDTLKQFLLKYKKSHSFFDLDTSMPLFTWEKYQGADTGDFPNLIYYPQFFTKEGHGGKTKAQILKEQTEGRWTLPPTAGSATGGTASAGVSGEKGLRIPGWTVHLLQPANPNEQDIETPKGFAPIPRQGKGTPQGDLIPRPPLETGQSPIEYLSIFQGAQDDENSPYHGESGLTPEDWITAFMIHLSETGKPMDNFANGIESVSNLTGAFFLSFDLVPRARWSRDSRRIHLFGNSLPGWVLDIGVRSSVIV